mmetsp:Transcript_75584/g.225311  ORF Transcript_75584/g.225311 Transcript_75584/m.225311 type:complete len:234 (+) Transcript_75584:143-844(+)
MCTAPDLLRRRCMATPGSHPGWGIERGHTRRAGPPLRKGATSQNKPQRSACQRERAARHISGGPGRLSVRCAQQPSGRRSARPTSSAGPRRGVLPARASVSTVARPPRRARTAPTPAPPPLSRAAASVLPRSGCVWPRNLPGRLRRQYAPAARSARQLLSRRSSQWGTVSHHARRPPAAPGHASAPAAPPPGLASASVHPATHRGQRPPRTRLHRQTRQRPPRSCSRRCPACA